MLDGIGGFLLDRRIVFDFIFDILYVCVKIFVVIEKMYYFIFFGFLSFWSNLFRRRRII